MIGSLLSSFRKVLNINFFLFILSLLLFAEIYNSILLKNENFYELFKNIDTIIPYIVLYLFIITILTPWTRFAAFLLLLIPWVSKVTELLKDERNEKLREEDYISLSSLKKLALKKESKVLYDYYLNEKESYESVQFTAQFSFINLVFITINYFFVKKGFVEIFFILDNWLLNVTILPLFFLMMFISIAYFRIDDRIIYKKDITPIEK